MGRTSLSELQPAFLICRGARNGALGHFWSPSQRSPVVVGCRLHLINVINRIFVSSLAWPCALVC